MAITSLGHSRFVIVNLREFSSGRAAMPLFVRPRCPGHIPAAPASPLPAAAPTQRQGSSAPRASCLGPSACLTKQFSNHQSAAISSKIADMNVYQGLPFTHGKFLFLSRVTSFRSASPSMCKDLTVLRNLIVSLIRPCLRFRPNRVPTIARIWFVIPQASPSSHLDWRRRERYIKLQAFGHDHAWLAQWGSSGVARTKQGDVCEARGGAAESGAPRTAASAQLQVAGAWAARTHDQWHGSAATGDGFQRLKVRSYVPVLGVIRCRPADLRFQTILYTEETTLATKYTHGDLQISSGGGSRQPPALTPPPQPASSTAATTTEAARKLAPMATADAMEALALGRASDGCKPATCFTEWIQRRTKPARPVLPPRTRFSFSRFSFFSLPCRPQGHLSGLRRPNLPTEAMSPPSSPPASMARRLEAIGGSRTWPSSQALRCKCDAVPARLLELRGAATCICSSAMLSRLAKERECHCLPRLCSERARFDAPPRRAGTRSVRGWVLAGAHWVRTPALRPGSMNHAEVQDPLWLKHEMWTSREELKAVEAIGAIGAWGVGRPRARGAPCISGDQRCAATCVDGAEEGEVATTARPNPRTEWRTHDLNREWRTHDLHQQFVGEKNQKKRWEKTNGETKRGSASQRALRHLLSFILGVHCRPRLLRGQARLRRTIARPCRLPCWPLPPPLSTVVIAPNRHPHLSTSDAIPPASLPLDLPPPLGWPTTIGPPSNVGGELTEEEGERGGRRKMWSDIRP
nr:unnamed protein product [Digitaria exilis]